MFERKDLEALAAFEGEAPVVSLYLNLPPHLRGTPDAYRARLKGLLKESWKGAAEEDLEALEAFFEKDFDWAGRSVVVFSSQKNNFWRVESFAVPIKSTIHIGDKPFIMPLATLMDNYGSFGVALIDQQSIRMFHFHLGELVASSKLGGEEIKRAKSGGGVAGRSRGDDVSGHTQEMVNRNLKEAAEALEVFCVQQRIEHLLLGGAETALHQFKGLLGQPYRDRVEGMFTIAVRAPDAEVLARALEIMQANEEAREARLVETVLTRAGKGANGVLGLEDTRAAVAAGRVQILVLVEGRLEPDIVDPLIGKTVGFGGEVEFVAPESSLANSGGIGALLRY
jgi:hypothetical protein